MRRAHRMPFGAELREDGVRFRLWAPSAKSVELMLGDKPWPMPPLEGGWYETFIPGIRAGARYGYRIDGGLVVPDPASRYQPDDVHGLSQVVDPASFGWLDDNWKGRPWEETVLYELHTGTFAADGSFAGVQDKLDYLADLGVTAVELLPVADFRGRRGWGYDGVLLYAPDSAYGEPSDLKRLVQAAHSRGLSVFMDVVYNHFGPEGNYLHGYAEQFFTDHHKTPWGKANNFDDEGAEIVRSFFIHNALYWLEEFNIDGIRFDAVHAIFDDSPTHFLTEMGERIRRHLPGRQVHLVLENDANEAKRLVRDKDNRPKYYDAQWNDDMHHLLHVATTGEGGGYYVDYERDPIGLLARALSSGFAYQGEASPHRDGEPRGEPSGELPPTAMVNFLQNHDQIGNRAFGERIAHLTKPEAVRAATAIYLLAPSIPMLFMGEEWAASAPFYYFCDFEGDLAAAVREGRREEFKSFPLFADPAVREKIPDPNAETTFLASKLDWAEIEAEPHKSWLSLTRALLRLRKSEIIPRLAGISGNQPTGKAVGRAVSVRWTLGDGAELALIANLGEEPARLPIPPGRIIFDSAKGSGEQLPPWSVRWHLAEKS